MKSKIKTVITCGEKVIYEGYSSNIPNEGNIIRSGRRTYKVKKLVWFYYKSNREDYLKIITYNTK